MCTYRMSTWKQFSQMQYEKGGIMKKSTFMRKFFRSAYEDSLYRLIKRNPEGVEANRERLDRQEEFFELLKERDPELLDKYDNLIDSFLHYVNLILCTAC